MFEEFKVQLVNLTGLQRDTLHVHVGLILFCLLYLVARTRRGLVLGTLGILVLAIGNEVADYRRIVQADDPFRPWEAISDTFNTVLWPALLALLVPLRDRRAPVGETIDRTRAEPWEETG